MNRELEHVCSYGRKSSGSVWWCCIASQQSWCLPGQAELAARNEVFWACILCVLKKVIKHPKSTALCPSWEQGILQVTSVQGWRKLWCSYSELVGSFASPRQRVAGQKTCAMALWFNLPPLGKVGLFWMGKPRGGVWSFALFPFQTHSLSLGA